MKSWGKGKTPLSWTTQMEKAYNEIKATLLNALALALPVVTKPFHMYVDEKKEISKGLRMQTLGPWKGKARRLIVPLIKKKKTRSNDYCLTSLSLHNFNKSFTW